ncbi:dipeptide ABC transporter ATP-binding protein [Krasilnikoviella flava]|uniref:Peptide/nickel transport system ATP-binding protein n=1 Tax=Krasilnikoviella flava TaxID=526729 RepID=A0A1T5LBL4_9MICO|nr:ABC transporter ATP-binding protein [Krasilnikoviella flava]SKC72788.1 peptide/nickel transport system ATP-binding protein [Krasilnikoviella flava]
MSRRPARVQLDEAAPLLEVSGLRTGFRRADGDDFVAVNGVSFTLRPGRSLAIVGESGSGKSVTVRSLLRLLPKTGRILDGEARFAGVDLVGSPDKAMRTIRGREIGMVFQNAMEALNPTIPVGRQLAEALTWHGLCSRSEARERAIATLADVGIPGPERRARMYPFQLSGGMRQRAMIAMAIIAEPRLVIADEPTTALDVTVQAQVLDLLAEIKARGTGMVMVTHDLGVARRFCDDVLVMNQGQVVETGPIADVLDSPREPYTRMLLDATLDVGDVARADARPVVLAAPAKRAPLEGSARVADRGTGDEVPASPAGAPIVVAEHLKKSFTSRGGTTHAVRDVSLSIERGRTLGLVGESGSGKSTVARLVMGLHEPDSGRVLLDGHDVHGDVSDVQRRRMQMVFQNPYGSLLPHYTAGANITEPLRLQGIGTPAERIERASELLQLVGLSRDDARRYPQQFSGGQQQRIAIARALAPEPDVLVCDEPTSALDVSIQAQILDLLSEIQDRLGVAYLLISHNLAVVETMSDEVAVMKDGAIVERGDRRTIFASPQHPYTHQLLGAILPVRGVGATSAATA